MIDIRDALLTDSLPEIISTQPWAKAMAAAVRIQVQQLLDLANRAQLYAAVREMPSNILDVMAYDLRVPEYSDSYEITVKRALVKGALTYWSKAGTKAAVEEICGDIFGDATVVEWFQYGADPGYFKVSTTNPSITDENVQEFRRVVETVKRLSAWLDRVELVLSTPNMEQKYGFAVHVSTHHTMMQQA